MNDPAAEPTAAAPQEAPADPPPDFEAAVDREVAARLDEVERRWQSKKDREVHRERLRSQTGHRAGIERRGHGLGGGRGPRGRGPLAQGKARGIARRSRRQPWPMTCRRMSTSRGQRTPRRKPPRGSSLPRPARLSPAPISRRPWPRRWMPSSPSRHGSLAGRSVWTPTRPPAAAAAWTRLGAVRAGFKPARTRLGRRDPTGVLAILAGARPTGPPNGCPTGSRMARRRRAHPGSAASAGCS